MVKWISGERMHAWRRGEEGGPALVSVLSLTRLWSSAEGGLGLGWKGNTCRGGCGKRKGKMRGRPGGRGQDTIDTTRKGRLLCVCVCARLDFCWEITCIRECHGHSHEGGGQTEHGHRLGETNSSVTSECSVICRLDPGGEKGRSWKSWGDPSKARSLAENVCSVTF